MVSFSLLLFLVVQALLPAEEPTREDIQNYLTGVQDQLRESYAFPDRVSNQMVVKGGKKELIRCLRTSGPDRLEVPDAFRRQLLGQLENSKTGSIRKLTVLVQRAIRRSTVEPDVWLPLGDTVAKGMIKSTGDSFSRLMTLEDLRQLQNRLGGGGNYRSLGVHVRKAEEGWYVKFVRYDSAAYRAGLRSGDQVVAVGDDVLMDKTHLEVKNLLKADPGTSKKVRILREDWEKPVTIQLHQRIPGSKTVESRMLPDDVGYVRLTMFGLQAPSKVRRALSGLAERGMDALVFDLRNNPGGAVSSAIGVSDLFLPDNSVITRTESEYDLMNNRIFRFIRSLLGRSGGPVHRASSTDPFEDIPLAVLINGSSASASEMTAGALQDHDRAILVGERSFGKGVGQTIVPVMSTSGLGSSAEGFLGSFMPTRFLYLTVMKYYLPEGRSIHDKGLTPDLPIKRESYSRRELLRLQALRHSDGLKKYTDRLLRNHLKKSKSLALYDEFKTDGYPGFGKFSSDVRENISKKLSTDRIRSEVRRRLRLRLDRRPGESYRVDLQQDAELQAALLKLTE